MITSHEAKNAFNSFGNMKKASSLLSIPPNSYNASILDTGDLTASGSRHFFLPAIPSALFPKNIVESGYSNFEGILSGKSRVEPFAE
jgi:hypothetical protein